MNSQIQFLISMLALNYILILIIIVVYRYMKYREYLGELDPLTGVMGRRMFLHYCEVAHRNRKEEVLQWRDRENGSILLSENDKAAAGGVS